MSGMGRYVIRQGLQLFATLLIILTISFFLFEALPARPVDLLALNPQITAAQKEEFVRTTGYDRPMWERYVLFLWHMLTFEFGMSFSTASPVADDLLPRMNRTVLLFGLAVILSYVIGVVLGAVIAWRRGGPVDGGVLVTGLLFHNMPSFWIGLIALYLFAFQWPIFALTASIPSADPTLFDYVHHWALPLLVLTLLQLSTTILLMRTSMLDVIGENYVTTAIAKGLSRRRVLFHHAARNAMLPVATGFVLSMVFAVGGAVVLEHVFSFPGVGSYFIDALYDLDVPAAQASLYILSLLVLVGNFATDILYGWLDPRVRIEGVGA